MKIATIAFTLVAVSLFGGAFAQSTIKTTPSNDSTAKKSDTAKPSVKTYTNEELGLSFDYPPDWKKSKVVIKNTTKFQLTDPKSWRPSKTENTTRFLMPLPGVDERGVLEIYSIQFNADTDIWQNSQRDINAQLKRTVLRQWQEEILGVPLLMTKIESNDKGEKLITETGMVYSATPRKLVFRVYASPDNFDKADAAWRQVMQSIRTVDGTLPSAEDPNRKLTQAELNPGSFRKTIWTAPQPPKVPLEKGAVAAEITRGGKKVQFLVPAGWKVQQNADGTFTLTSPVLTGAVKVAVQSDVDSDPAGKALIHASGASLDPFTKVLKREEKGPFVSRSQMNVIWIFRNGLAGAKPHFSYDAAGQSGDYYWVATWSGDDAGGATKDRHALDALVDVMSVEPAP